MKRAAFLPADFGKRTLYALGSGGIALAFCAVFAEGPLAWGSWTLWLFSAAVAALGFGLFGKID